MAMKSIYMKTLPKQGLVREGSFGSIPIEGEHESTMEVFADANGTPTYIEWDIPEIDEVVGIGLEIEGNNVTGYDGTMSMPQDAIDILKELGYDTSEIE